MVPKIVATVDAREGEDRGRSRRGRSRPPSGADTVEAAWQAEDGRGARRGARPRPRRAKAQATKAAEAQVQAADAELAERLGHHDLAVANAKAEALANLQTVAAEAAQELVAKLSRPRRQRRCGGATRCAGRRRMANPDFSAAGGELHVDDRASDQGRGRAGACVPPAPSPGGEEHVADRRPRSGFNSTGWVAIAAIVVLICMLVKKVPGDDRRMLDTRIAAIRAQLDEAQEAARRGRSAARRI